MHKGEVAIDKKITVIITINTKCISLRDLDDRSTLYTHNLNVA